LLPFTTNGKNHEIAKILKIIGQLSLPLSTRGNIAIESLHQKKTKLTNNLHDLIVPLISKDEAARMQVILKAQTFAVYPILVGSHTLGVLVIGLEKSVADLSQSERETLHELIDVVGLAIERSQIYASLQRANKKLKELDQMKDDFVSVASHELRTPMTAIKSYLWLALDGRGGKLTEKQKYYLDRAYISTDRLIKLVNDMLNISRIESGRITIEMNKIDIQQLVQDVIDEVKPRADEVKVKVTLDQPQKKILPVLADPDKIKEVLFNIIGNSLKFTPEKGTITISFESKEDGHVIIHVRDTGRGIDEKDMGTLFTKFGMVEGSYVTNKKASGTGLGLYISKSIIELHKGKIWAQSPGIDQGTTFSFTLPYYKKGDKVVIKPEKSVEDRKLGIIHSGI